MAKNKNSSRFTNHSIINKDTPFSVIEAFKAARTNLMFMLDSNRDKNSIVFSSYAPMDGKSTTCLNLAITFAQTGAKILVIDADMRRPSLHRYLKTQSKPGLSDVLAGMVDDKPYIYKSEIENLYILPAGTIPPNPTELLISKRMETLLNDCAPLFDYIFIDTPPLGLVTDAAIVGAKTLGIINVVNCEHSRSEDIESIKNTIDQAGINLIGCIINSVPLAATNKKYHLSNSSYGYYSYSGNYNSNNYDYYYQSKDNGFVQNEADTAEDDNEDYE